MHTRTMENIHQFYLMVFKRGFVEEVMTGLLLAWIDMDVDVDGMQWVWLMRVSGDTT